CTAREGLRRCASALVASNQASLLQPSAESVTDFVASQIMISPSDDDGAATPTTPARRLPSGLKATFLTDFASLRVRTSRPLAASHNFTVLSSDAVARRLPSGLKATPMTACVCPLRVLTSWPLSASHNFTVLSAEAVAKRLLSGL